MHGYDIYIYLTRTIMFIVLEVLLLNYTFPGTDLLDVFHLLLCSNLIAMCMLTIHNLMLIMNVND